jgi:hypothetical protein
VLLKPTTVKAACKGTAVALAPPFAADAGVILELPAAAATTRYCAKIGGTEVKNDPTIMKRKDAPAPAACAEPPTALDPEDLAALAADALMGRNNDTAGSAAAQQILIDLLEEMGATGADTMQTGDDAFKQPFVESGQTGTNVIGIIPGSELPNEYVIVGAHYDHLGSCTVETPGDTICNGATDNAAGVASVLGVGRRMAAMPVKPRRSVVLAFWDAEEDNLLGSLYYVNHPLVPLASTTAYVNFDIQGANLLPSLRSFTFAVGPETASGLDTLISQAAGVVDLEVRQLSLIFGQGRSDHVNFVNFSIPTVFFSDSTGPCYHTSDDEISIVDFDKLQQQNGYTSDVVLALLNAVTPPTFVPPNPLYATFADAVIINEVLTAGLADLSLFTPADQAVLTQSQAIVATIVAAGPGAFDVNDIVNVLLTTVGVIDLLTHTQCDGFFP